RPRPPPQQYEAKGGRWTAQEHAAFLEGIKLFGKNWRRVAQVVGTRNAVQTRTHAQKYLLKTSAHLELHLALLKKDGSVGTGDDDEVGLEEEANAAVLTSLTQGKPSEAGVVAPMEVEAGMDRLSSLMLKAESMHNHMLESAETIRSPLDALNFSAPLLLSPRWTAEKPVAASPPLRKLILGRKADEINVADGQEHLKKVKLEPTPVEADGENVDPNSENVSPNMENESHNASSTETIDMVVVPDVVAAANHTKDDEPAAIANDKRGSKMGDTVVVVVNPVDVEFEARKNTQGEADRPPCIGDVEKKKGHGTSADRVETPVDQDENAAPNTALLAMETNHFCPEI
ncbi:hypothetical protein As57867_013650, partial [Aphanomyces stellatus]